MAKGKYVVTEGKHEIADGVWIRAGDPAFEMDSAEAERFPNKFKQVTVAAPVDPDADVDDAKKAAEAANAAKKVVDDAKKAAAPK